MYIKKLAFVLNFILISTSLFAQDDKLLLECRSASNDWIVHVDAANSVLKIYSTSQWSQQKTYFYGDYEIKNSSYRVKELQNHQQRCHEVLDKNGIMKLQYCVASDDFFYSRKDVQTDEKIQEKFRLGYYFGLGEVQFFIKPPPIAVGTLFYCFEEKEINL